MKMVTKFSWSLGVLFLMVAAIPLIADAASARKRPASVQLKTPAQKMPMAKKAARPPERRKSEQPLTKPGVITQPAPAYSQAAQRASASTPPTAVTPSPSGSAVVVVPPVVPPAVPRQAQRQDVGGRPSPPRRGSSIRLLKQVSLRKFGARVFASMKSIFISTGQQKYIPHEAWHVVQQNKGRIQPTMQN